MKLTESKLRGIIRKELRKLEEEKHKPNQFFADADSSHPVNRLYAFMNVGPNEVRSVYIIPCAPDKTAFLVKLKSSEYTVSYEKIQEFKNQYSDISYALTLGKRVYFTWDGRF